MRARFAKSGRIFVSINFDVFWKPEFFEIISGLIGLILFSKKIKKEGRIYGRKKGFIRR